MTSYVIYVMRSGVDPNNTSSNLLFCDLKYYLPSASGESSKEFMFRIMWLADGALCLEANPDVTPYRRYMQQAIQKASQAPIGASSDPSYTPPHCHPMLESTPDRPVGEELRFYPSSVYRQIQQPTAEEYPVPAIKRAVTIMPLAFKHYSMAGINAEMKLMEEEHHPLGDIYMGCLFYAPKTFSWYESLNGQCKEQLGIVDEPGRDQVELKLAQYFEKNFNEIFGQLQVFGEAATYGKV